MKVQVFFLVLAWSASAIAKADFPPATVRIADCENHWFLKEAKEADSRVLGFAYIDPEAGFTFEHDGEVALDAKGELALKPDPLRGKARLIVRVGEDFPVACLEDGLVAKLGMQPTPDWLKAYEDKRDPATHAVSWASHLNQIGAYEQAIRQIDIARKAADHSDRMWFELAYAYDAQEHFEQSIAVLEPTVTASPDAIALLGELAYAHMHHGDYPRAIELYRKAIAGYRESPDTPAKWEYAFNLAQIYRLTGDAAAEAEWVAKAKAWHPPEAAH